MPRSFSTTGFFLTVLIFILFWGALPPRAAAEIKQVCFQHKTRDTLITNCIKTIGKHDVTPGYKCFDKKGELKAFDPEEEWEELSGNDKRCREMDPSAGLEIPHGLSEKEAANGKGKK